MNEPAKPYQIHEIGQLRKVRAVAPAGWYSLTKDKDGKDKVLHLPVACEVDNFEKLVMVNGVGKWTHDHFDFGTAVPVPPPPPKPPGIFARLWARLRGRRLPQARLLPGPRPKVPSTVAEALDEWSGW